MAARETLSSSRDVFIAVVKITRGKNAKLSKRCSPMLLTTRVRTAKIRRFLKATKVHLTRHVRSSARTTLISGEKTRSTLWAQTLRAKASQIPVTKTSQLQLVAAPFAL